MLSDAELHIALNAHAILTKRVIIEKAAMLFSSFLPQISLLSAEPLHAAGIYYSIPKITRGENYEGLPYVIMDYPGVFAGEDIFALRTMFWWGNFISITLQVSGIYREHFEERILFHLKQSSPELFICINENQWQHHFRADNYVSIDDEIISENIKGKSFLKVSLKYELHQWNLMQSLMPDGYKKIFDLLKA